MKKFPFLLTGFLLIACSEDSKVAGASTVETENAYIVKFVDSDSIPVTNAVGRIRPSWYVQSIDSGTQKESVIEFTTDSLGEIRIDSLQSETAFIEMVNKGSGVFREIFRPKNGDNETSVLKLEKTGSISGKVNLPEGNTFAWVQIYGTDRLVKTDSTGFFSLDSLPPFEYQIQAVTSENEPVIGIGIANVKSGSTNDIGTLKVPTRQNEDLSQWTHEKTLPLSSLVSEWMKPIADSTVIFVRLDSSNFNFKEAMKNGEDLRFTDKNGASLESQIAAWDDSLQNGCIRVRINGFDENDSICMYWGRKAAIDINSKSIWKDLPDSLYLALNSLQVINFDSKKLESAFEYEDGLREWYYGGQNEDVTTTPSLENVSEAFEKDESREGYVFHWKSESKTKYLWSMIGTRLNKHPANLEGIDSISFYAKGSGELGFAFEVLDEPTGKVKYVDYLDENWNRFAFTPKDFVEGDEKYGNMGWDFVKSRTTTITIWIVDESEMWIDDVRIYGINRDDVN